MNRRTNLDQDLLNFISAFEQYNAWDKKGYLTEECIYQLIDHFEEESNHKKALEVAEIAVKQFPYRVEFLMIKAKILLIFGNLEEAFELLDKADAIAPYQSEIKILKAKVLGISGDCGDALELLENLKEGAVNSDLTEILICESYIYEYLKDYSHMYDSLVQAVFIDSKHEEIMERLWKSLKYLKNYSDGVDVINKIIDKDPYHYLAWFNLGHCYINLGEYKDGIDALEYSFITNPEFIQGYLDCGEMCFQLGKFSKALDIYTDFNNKFGPDTDALTCISECQIKLGKIKEAKHNILALLKLDIYNVELFYLLGLCYYKEKSFYKAVNAFHEAISDEEDIPEEYYHALAKSYAAIEDFEKALEFYRKAAISGEEQPYFWRSYISVLIRLQKYEEAKEALEEADAYTFGAELIYCRAAIYFLTGNRAKGMSILEEALKEDFDSHKVLFKMQPEFELDPLITPMISYYRNELDEEGL